MTVRIPPFVTVATVVLMVSLGGCQERSGKAAWNDVVRHCASSDLDSKTILYFGPSNNVGPGSVWRKKERGGYGLRWTAADMPGVEETVLAGAPIACDGTTKVTFNGEASLGLLSSLTPVSGEIAADLKRAKSITVSANSLSWDTLREGPFEIWFGRLSDEHPAKRDLAENSRLVSTRALRVTGFVADLQFDSEVAANLTSKYSGSISKALTGELSSGLQGRWISDTNLRIGASDFYIAGELGKFDAKGFTSSVGGTFIPVEIRGTEVSLDSR